MKYCHCSLNLNKYINVYFFVISYFKLCLLFFLSVMKILLYFEGRTIIYFFYFVLVIIKKEATNFLRIVHLLFRVVCPVVRMQFDYEIQPNQLQKTLFQYKPELENKYRKKDDSISNYQWDLLYKNAEGTKWVLNFIITQAKTDNKKDWLCWITYLWVQNHVLDWQSFYKKVIHSRLNMFDVVNVFRMKSIHVSKNTIRSLLLRKEFYFPRVSPAQ